MGYEAFALNKDLRVVKITQNAKKFGVERLENEALVKEFLNCEQISLDETERENIEQIFTNLMKIEEEVQLSR
ncbi:acetyltransferase [Campylobacter sp. RM16187]|uniref:acetyltransferase n=1 Tax=Campylobacter sp. RM16187 TaxID=1660063 RepID=UPI0021B58332|nr:acetyltransferase [Campylobacter sp. RM16187]QKG29928.1 hypothetical protein CDOMF_1695 [Campylobacter sp. RM16187]